VTDYPIEQVASDLRERFARAVNVLQGYTASAANPGRSIAITCRNPINGQDQTITAEAIGLVPTGPVTAFQDGAGSWFVVSQLDQNQWRSVTTLRHRQPRSVTQDLVWGGVVYAERISGLSTPQFCPFDPNAPRDPNDDPTRGPPDPDHPKLGTLYRKTWIQYLPFPDSDSNAYPVAKLNAWLFDSGKYPYCSLPLQGNLPDFPFTDDPYYNQLGVVTYTNANLSTLYEQPDLNSHQWNFQSNSWAGRGNLFTVTTWSSLFSGSSAPAIPPSMLWAYVYGVRVINYVPVEGYYWQQFPTYDNLRVIGDEAAGKCAPKLPPPPQPDPPDPDPPNDGSPPGTPATNRLWFFGGALKKAVKLLDISTQESFSKPDILFPRDNGQKASGRAVVLVKYGSGYNIGIPASIDRGYCKVSVFEIKADGAVHTFTYSADMLVQGKVRQKLIDLGVIDNLFFAPMSSPSYYTNDTTNLQTLPANNSNPLYRRWLVDGSIADLALPFISRHARNTVLDTRPGQIGRALVADFQPTEDPRSTNPPFSRWLDESIYGRLKPKPPVTIALRYVSIQPFSQYTSTQAESATNPRFLLV
jgi:hypothetical protein